MMSHDFLPVAIPWGLSKGGVSRKIMTEDFDDSQIPASIWTLYQSGAGALAIAIGPQLQAQVPPGSVNWSGMYFTKQITLDRLLLSCDMAQGLVSWIFMFSPSSTLTYVSGDVDQDYVRVLQNNSNIYIQHRVAGVTTTDLQINGQSTINHISLWFGPAANNQFSMFLPAQGWTWLNQQVPAITKTGYLHLLGFGGGAEWDNVIVAQNYYGGVVSGF